MFSRGVKPVMEERTLSRTAVVRSRALSRLRVIGPAFGGCERIGMSASGLDGTHALSVYGVAAIGALHPRHGNCGQSRHLQHCDEIYAVQTSLSCP